MSEQEPIGPGRRMLLATAANPAQRLDYVVQISRKLGMKPPAGRVTLNIRYIPDRLILTEAAIPGYMRALEGTVWGNLETMTQAILDDFCNEIVPRWIEVSVTERAGEADNTFDYAVAMEDRQPSWSNPQLLSRLKPWEHI